MATALHITPAAVRQMTLPEIYALCDYWQSWPPEHEILAILTSAMTSWKPAEKPLTEAEIKTRQQQMWKSGAAASPADLFRKMGGSARGTDMPGIGRFPGT